ncbi:MAG: O-antigen ligase family protein [Candidatus Blackburnbacteria bacterium]|nr:O-antigen ligase family protein [Candidatus Blackburnbacteria bacterium]
MILHMYRFADKLQSFSLYAIFAIVPLFFSSLNSELFEIPKMAFVYVFAILVLFSWAIKSLLQGRFLFRRTPLDIPLAIFLLALSLSTLTSIDRYTSFWGYYSRPFGGFVSTATFVVLYWAYVSNMGKRETENVIRILIGSAVVISIWGILEHFGVSPSCVILKGEFNVSCWAPDVRARVFATFGQPNWMAAWLVAVAPLSWQLILRCKAIPLPMWNTLAHREILSRSALYISPFLLFTAILYTKSRSGLVAFGVSFVIFWSFVFFHQSRKVRPCKPRCQSFLLIVTSYLLLVAFSGSPWSPSITQLFGGKSKNIDLRVASNVVGNESSPSPPSGGTDSFAIRKIVWKGAIDIWKHYPILGSGVETFAYTYYNFRPQEHNYTSEWDLLYNKAHNEYLHYLANTGLVGLGSYLLLIGAFLWNIKKRVLPPEGQILKIKNINQNLKNFFTLNFALLSGFVSILITNSVSFSTVSIATLFFLFPAMAITLKSDSLARKLETRKNNESRADKLRLLSLLFPLLVVCYLLFVTYRFWYADTLYKKAVDLVEQGEGNQSSIYLEQALKMRPNEPRYLDKLASSTSIVAAYLSEDAQKPKEAKELAEVSERFSNSALIISPYNVQFWSNRAIYFKRLAAIEPKYLLLAVEALEKAARLAPTDPKIHYNLGVLYSRSGDLQKALATLQKSVELKTDYYDARVGLAELYLENGEKEKAINELEFVLKNINPADKDVKEVLEKLKK